MTLNWTPEESSRSTPWDDSHSQAAPSASTQTSPRIPKPNRLLAIDDFDFEALIEILGTDGDAGKVHMRYKNSPLDDMQVLRDRERKPRLDRSEPLSARRVRTVSLPNKQTTAPRSSAKAILTSQKPTTTSPNEPAVTSNSAPFMPTSRTADPRGQQRTMPSTKSQFTSKRNDERRSQENAKSNGNASFVQLNRQLGSSVAETRTQVTDLQNRIQDLKDEVKDFAPHLYRRAFDTQTQRPTNENLHPPATLRRTNTKATHSIPPPTEARTTRKPELDPISALSEDEAKNALMNICRTLNLDPSTLPTTQPPVYGSTDFIPPTNLSSLTRALRVVSEMDELVWKDTGLHNLRSEGQASDDVYDEDNIQAILDRVRLWERTARSRVKR